MFNINCRCFFQSQNTRVDINDNTIQQSPPFVIDGNTLTSFVSITPPNFKIRSYSHYFDLLLMISLPILHQCQRVTPTDNLPIFCGRVTCFYPPPDVNPSYVILQGTCLPWNTFLNTCCNNPPPPCHASFMQLSLLNMDQLAMSFYYQCWWFLWILIMIDHCGPIFYLIILLPKLAIELKILPWNCYSTYNVAYLSIVDLSIDRPSKNAKYCCIDLPSSKFRESTSWLLETNVSPNYLARPSWLMSSSNVLIHSSWPFSIMKHESMIVDTFLSAWFSCTCSHELCAHNCGTCNIECWGYHSWKIPPYIYNHELYGHSYCICIIQCLA